MDYACYWCGERIPERPTLLIRGCELRTARYVCPTEDCRTGGLAKARAVIQVAAT